MSDSIDTVFFTDDLGTQNAPLLNLETYRKIIKPYWTDLIPDFIEMGVHAVNPVQTTAGGMDPLTLKREFGREITFWGGGISTQGVLDSGSVQDVKDEVRRNIDIFAPGGGFVFTQVHNIQYNVPPENIVAAYETAHSDWEKRLRQSRERGLAALTREESDYVPINLGSTRDNSIVVA